MAVRDIVLYAKNETALRKRSKPVRVVNRRIKKLVKDLKDTLETHPEGIGLAAPQINIHQRVALVRLNSKNEDGQEPDPPIALINPEIIENWNELITDKTKFLFVETPSNPNLFIGDIETLSKIAKENEIPLIVDNTIATPALQQPVKLGADIIVHSGTKYLSGNSTCISGVVAGSKEYIDDVKANEYRNIGPSISPFNSWLLLLGVETLSLRMRKHNENAQAVAEFLENHSKVVSVNYPGLKSHPQYELAKKQMKGFGGMIGFELKTIEECYKFIDLLKLIKVGVSLGDTTSLIEYTSVMTGIDLASWEKRRMNMSDTHFRFSIGLEHPDDIIKDLEQALPIG